MLRDIARLPQLVHADPAAAHLVMADVLHRAIVIDACQRGDGPRNSGAYWPERRPDYYDYDHARASDGAAYAAVLASWERDGRAYASREIDAAYAVLDLLVGLPQTRRRALYLRALQEHARPGERPSWRRIAHILNCSHEACRTWHFEAVQHALRQAIIRAWHASHQYHTNKTDQNDLTINADLRQKTLA